MVASQRKNLIREIILTDGFVKAEELAKRFSVSEETIRRDLSELEKNGYLKKQYGGAVAIEELQRVFNGIPPVQQRKFSNLNEKNAMGRYAASLISNGMKVFFDAGSSTWSILRHLQDITELTVVTNSIDIAYECSEKLTWEIFVMGGQLITKSMCMVGPEVEEQIKNMNIDIAFLGTSGISKTGICTSSNLLEANVKKQIINVSEYIVLLADHSKFGIRELCTFSSISEISELITSNLLSDELQSALLPQCKKYMLADINN